MDKEPPVRLLELEEKAKDIFIQNSDWSGVIDCLDRDEKEEYWKLHKETYGDPNEY